MKPRFAVLVDGGFFTKALAKKNRVFPTAEQIRSECLRLAGLKDFENYDLLRIYFYDAPPVSKKLKNPVSGLEVDLGATEIFRRHTEMLSAIEQFDNFAVRKGETVVRGWSLGDRAAKDILRRPRSPVAEDLVPNIEQKGVDLRIGLDIARLALKEVVQSALIITGDSDMIPAFKFARREGMRIYLHYADMPVRQELKVHADVVIK
jgi:uncharacterized LabA/DUF88 family protein